MKHATRNVSSRASTATCDQGRLIVLATLLASTFTVAPVLATDDATGPSTTRAAWRNPLVKLGYLNVAMAETTPFVFRDRLYLMETYVAFVDSVSKAVGADADKDVVRIRDLQTQKIVSSTLPRHSFATAFVWDGRVYLFAAKRAEGQPWRTSTEVSVTSSADLEQWSAPVVVWRCEPTEQVFNVAVCRGPDRFVLLCETNDPKYPPFTFKYFESADLTAWKPVPGGTYGTDKYVGGPALYYEGGWYYTLFLHHLRSSDYETRITRSRDLTHWQDAPADRPFLSFDRKRNHMPLRSPELTESNASDAELCHFRGKTIVYFSGGDQQYAGDLQRAEFDGTPRQLFERFFDGVPEAMPR